MDGKGIHGNDARIEWSELMRFKRTFTDPVPEEREKTFAKARIGTVHGVARFTNSNQLQVGEEILEGRHILMVLRGALTQGCNVRLVQG
jgi:glutathione reductase (NADPH)